MNQIELKRTRFGADGTNGCTYWHLPELNALMLDWNGNVTTAEFIEIHLKGLDLMVELDATAWISDSRKLGPISPEADEWLQQVCFPLSISTTKISKLAIVLPEDVFGQLSSIEITTNLEQQLEENPAFLMKNFGSLDDALSWV